ncbi:MAG: putative mannose-sensitive agglutinin (MSHA) biogenesis protein MshP [Candidatus Gallionella acididurans]|uniref:Putative mannose-sensitive agglutinin (MSHA) biogenesis protein MshP n=1 Tax=Candidatus Gallionella acididurans TaxID=1796491 RepID=A0A139BU48_9PROT|nr:MAG: putative mannose-sensitive agglutinin (MSHA) biogenesis protein MshP [Candidatus Gallionella acididurans]
MVVCRCAARLKRLRGKVAIKSQSSALSPQSSERGFSLISAIFLLVVIAALGTFAVTLSTTQQQSAALDVLGSRAYQAARAGIEWGAYQILRNSNPCPNQVLTGLPNTLSGFTVNVACTAYPVYNEAGNTVNMYQLSSTAFQGTPNTPNYVERNLTVTIAK